MNYENRDAPTKNYNEMKTILLVVSKTRSLNIWNLGQFAMLLEMVLSYVRGVVRSFRMGASCYLNPKLQFDFNQTLSKKSWV